MTILIIMALRFFRFLNHYDSLLFYMLFNLQLYLVH